MCCLFPTRLSTPSSLCLTPTPRVAPLRSPSLRYIDARDAASSVLYSLGLITPTPLGPGHHIFLIANADTVSPSNPTSTLVEKHFPGVPYAAGWTGKGSKFEGLLSTAKAKRELGWESQYGWRGQVEVGNHEKE